MQPLEIRRQMKPLRAAVRVVGAAFPHGVLAAASKTTVSDELPTHPGA